MLISFQNVTITPRWYKNIFLLFLVSAPLVNNPWGTANPSEIPKFVLLSLLIGALSILGAFFLLTQKKIFIRAHPILIIGGILWLLSCVLSTVFSIAPVESFWGTYANLKGLITLIQLGILFYFLYAYIINKNDKWLTYMIQLVGILTATWGLIQFFLLDSISIFGDGQLFAGRIYGTLSNPNDLGQYLIFPFSFALAGTFHKDFLSKNWKWKLINILCLIIVTCALLLTKNRASLLGIALVGSVYFFVLCKFFWQRLLLINLIGISILGSIALGLGDSRSLMTRMVLWSNVPQMVQDFPLLGSGPETYYQTVQRSLSKELYVYEKLISAPEHPHNETLNILMEEGILGLIIYLILFFLLSVKIWQYIQKNKVSELFIGSLLALSGTLISIQFGYNSMTQLLLIVLCLSIICHTLFAYKNHTFTVPIILRLPAALGILSGVIFICSTALGLLRADIVLGTAIQARMNNDPSATPYFQQAIAFAPHYAYPYSTYVLMSMPSESQDTTLKNVIDSYGIITAQNYHYYIMRGLFALSTHQEKDVQTYYALSKLAAPQSFFMYYQWAKGFADAERKTEALSAAHAAWAVVPNKWKTFDSDEFQNEKNREAQIFAKSNFLYFGLKKIFEELKEPLPIR